MELPYPAETESNSWDIIYSNLGQTCRTCGLESEFLMPIFEGEGLQHHLDLKIQTYLQLQVLKDDTLPLQLCYDCFSTILSWHSLFLKCQESNHKFHAMLSQKQQVAFSERHGSVVISPPETLHHSSNPTHPFSPLHLTMVSPNEVNHIASATGPSYHTFVSCTPDLALNHSPSRCTDTVQSEVQFCGFEQQVPLSQTDSCEGVLDGVIGSNLLSVFPSVPVSDSLLNSPYMSGSISATSTAQYNDHSIPLTHVSTQTDHHTKDKMGDDCNSSPSKKEIIIRKENCTNLSDVGKMSSDDNLIAFQTSICPSEAKETVTITNRVSAIRSISSNQVLPVEERSGRSKSVLVRNEFVPAYSSDFSARKNSMERPSSMDTLVESAVIRKHQNVDRTRESEQGTMVSVVRPTCLRRAPTAVVVIESINGDCDGAETHNKDETMSEELRETHIDYANCTQRSTDCTDLFPGSLELLSPTSSFEESRIVDLSHSCFHCGKFITNTVLLLSHERSHLADENPPSTYSCKFCSKSQSSMNEMHLHYNSHETSLDKGRKSQGNRKAYLCKLCGLMCTTEERLAAHQRLHIDSGECLKHECKTCGETFNTRSKLSVHLWTHALKPSLKTFKCHICGKGFGTKSAVMEHRLKHTEEEKSRAFKCIVCGMAFGNNTQLGKHRSTHSAEELARPFKCSFCSKAFARNHTLQIHYFTHSNEKSHICTQCGKGFKMRNSLIQHLRTHQDPSNLPSYPCQMCGKAFRVRSRLRDHMRLHSGDKPYRCSTCGKNFHKIGALRTHEVSHTERRPYMCDICGKAFKWSKNLRQHKSVHISMEGVPNQISTLESEAKSSNVKKVKPKTSQPCQCEICGKQLSCKSSLRTHLSSMHSERQPKQVKSTSCSVCGKVLSTSGALIRHLKTTHGGVKAFKCDICDREYSTKVARDDHRRSHTGERPYSCSTCPKTFTSLSNLHIHRSSHSDDRPFKCTFCDKQFKRRAHLVPHIRIHTGEKPYVCSICSRGFAQSNDLHKHRLTHSDDKAFTCHCGMAYRVKRDLRRHQAKHHPHGLSTHSPVDVILPSTSGFDPNSLVPLEEITSVPAQEDRRNDNVCHSNLEAYIPNYDGCITQSVVVFNADVCSAVNNL